MDLLIAPYTVAKEQADAAPATGTPGWATDGNPSTNKPATQWPAYAFNAMQEELVALIQGGGQTLNRNDNTLLFKAVKALIESNLERFAPLESPEFTGTPTAPTPVVTDNSTKLSTTAFVKSVVAGVAAVPATTLVSGISRRATTPEAQALTSSDTTLSPASLRAAFQGTNYSATFNGFQILPSGIIEQWGVVALVTLPANSASDAVVTFPMAFTANALSIAISVETPAPTQVSCSVMTDTLTTTGVTLRRGNSSTSTPWNVVVRYRVIGR